MSMPTPLFDEPFAWFELWFAEAEATGIKDPNAMCVSTVDAEGRPSSRIVLLKEFDERGFVFYTNLESQKGVEALGQGVAALNFYWRDLARQIRIEGAIEVVSDEQADAYFASRPRGSQVGAWASQQSRPLESREALMSKTGELERKYDGQEVPRPGHWSGLRVKPRRIEFWQAGEFRLHDRFVFTRAEDAWSVERLNP